jgi:hypothetical protein
VTTTQLDLFEPREAVKRYVGEGMRQGRIVVPDPELTKPRKVTDRFQVGDAVSGEQTERHQIWHPPQRIDVQRP